MFTTHWIAWTDEKWLDGVSVIRTIAHAYDDAGNLVSASDSDFTYGYTYDDLGQLKTQSNQGTPGVPVVSFAYQYDNGGDLISRSEVIGVGPAVTTRLRQELIICGELRVGNHALGKAVLATNRSAAARNDQRVGPVRCERPAVFGH